MLNTLVASGLGVAALGCALVLTLQGGHGEQGLSAKGDGWAPPQAIDGPSSWSRRTPPAKGAPRPTGTLTGFDPELRYEQLPPLILELEDLPAGGRVYVRTRPEGKDRDEARILPGSEVVAGPERACRVVLRDADDHFTEEGRHSVEVVLEGGVADQVLCRTRVTVDRTVTWPGGILYPEE